VGKKTGPNPTDRAKSGTKRSLLTDGDGIPLALAVAGANVPDMRLVSETLHGFALRRPRPKPGGRKQHLCGDKGYDYPTVRSTLRAFEYTLHIAIRGEPQTPHRKIPNYRARRWVVERSHSWMNRFRRLLIRWEKKAANYEAFLHLACAWIALRAAGVFG
jgi:putative transposase